MKKLTLSIVSAMMLASCSQTVALQNDVSQAIEENTEQLFTVSTLTYKKHETYDLALDLYLPNKATATPHKLLVWVHGGAWFRGSKDEFIPRNGNLARSLLDKGYAIAAVNYSLSGQAIFPTPVRDINDAINFVVDSASDYNIEPTNITMMGRSAGGHLAALIATSNHNSSTNLYLSGHEPKYNVSAVVDFFGVSDLEELKGNSGRVDHDAPDAAEARFLGESPRVNPELARKASPTHYINDKTPPFILFHGGKDQIVPASQSYHLKAQLDEMNITNQLFIEEGAKHGDPVFDSLQQVTKVVEFLKEHFPTK